MTDPKSIATLTVSDMAVATVRAARATPYFDARVPMAELLKFAMELAAQIGVQIVQDDDA